MFELSAANRKQFDDDGFLIVDELIDSESLSLLHQAFTELFRGEFETGVRPDEVNWQEADSDPERARQICNGWKANRVIASVVLDENLGKTIASLAGWPGVRIMHDNVVWKPPATTSFSFHQDNAFLRWFRPGEIFSCWIALDDTRAEGGTIEFVRGSHQWQVREPEGEFHAPKDYRKPMMDAAAQEGVEPEIAYVEVKAGGGSFHHGVTWHGSGANQSSTPRRSLVLHAMRSDVEYVPEHFNQGNGPIYSRYRRLGDNQFDENYFPILWREDGYRTPQIDAYLDPP